MRTTNIEYTCKKCGKQFLLFSDDGGRDEIICWNYCPHCGERNDIWIRFVSDWELKNGSLSPFKVGISAEEAARLKAQLEGRTITLYHGTTSKWRSRIRREGFHKYTWFTESKEGALGHAKWAVRRDGGTETDVWEAVFPVSAIAFDTARELGGQPKEEGGFVRFYKFFKKPKPLTARLVSSTPIEAIAA